MISDGESGCLCSAEYVIIRTQAWFSAEGLRDSGSHLIAVAAFRRITGVCGALTFVLSASGRDLAKMIKGRLLLSPFN